MVPSTLSEACYKSSNGPKAQRSHSQKILIVTFTRIETGKGGILEIIILQVEQ